MNYVKMKNVGIQADGSVYPVLVAVKNATIFSVNISFVALVVK